MISKNGLRVRRFDPTLREVDRDMTPVARTRKPRHVTADAGTLCALMLALFLLLGILAGRAESARCAVDDDALRVYLDAAICRSGDDLTVETAARTLWCYVRGSLCAFLLGFSSAGVVGLPLLLAAQGFVLTFSLCSFASALGRGGFLLCVALFGLRLAFVLPCTFLLGTAAMERSWALWSLVGGRRVQLPALWFRFCVCGAALLLGCALELWLVPLLLAAAV